MSTWPTTLDDLQPVPTLQSDTPTHDDVHDAERSAINALQAGVGTAGISRLVQRFADTTARDAAIPTPTAGMVCSADGTLQTNTDGTVGGWSACVTGSSEDGVRISSGTAIVSFVGASDATIAVTFTEPFLTSPVVIATARPFAARRYVATVNPPSATGFTLFVTEIDRTASTNDIEVQWVAIGGQ